MLEVEMARSTVFKSNRSQAVRLPKDVAFPESVHQVEIIKVGDARVIAPAGQRWKEFFENGPHVSDDFMVERVQPPLEKREEF
jgi:antitoxin VapB